MRQLMQVNAMARLVFAIGLSARAVPAQAADEWGADGEDAESTPPAAPADAPAPEAQAPEPTATVDPAVDSAPRDDEAPAGAGSDFLLGARYRGIVIPHALLGLFIEGGESVYVNGVGPELALRDDDVEYIFSAWLAFYDMSPVPIKGSSDAEEAWEIVESDMKALYLTADYLTHSELAPRLELSYGGGAGLGILFGDLYRTQATLAPGGARGNPDDYVPCQGVNMPPELGYCDDYNNHYGGFSEPSWFNGGAKPVFFPWLAGQVGLRYQAHERFVARLDVGFGTSGLFFGLGADYGL